MSRILCCLCDHTLGSVGCPHPWKKPFDQWPGHLLTSLRKAIGT